MEVNGASFPELLDCANQFSPTHGSEFVEWVFLLYLVSIFFGQPEKLHPNPEGR
jgi:hypothetical protein